LTARKQAAANAVLSQQITGLFLTDPILCFLKFDKTHGDVFGILPKFFKNFMQSDSGLVVLRPGRNPRWLSSKLFQLFAASLFKALA